MSERDNTPRRFELVGKQGEAYAHGVQFANGHVAIAHPYEMGVVVHGSMTTEEVAQRYVIRWIDPPFGSEE